MSLRQAGFLLLTVLVTLCRGDVLKADNLPNHQKLSDDYDLYWDFNVTHIMLQTHVKTNGYIGFGISDNGNMYPSDVIIAWVKSGKVHFADRHATGHSTPLVDKSQDWFLVEGKEEGEYTTITMVRKLNTCDKDDRPITVGTTGLIYSYSPKDPESDDEILYHGPTTRGTKSVLMLNRDKNSKHKPLPDDVTTLDFLNQNYSVPADDTTYACSIFKLPPLDGKHHMIRYEPVIQEGHEQLIHHIILYFCTKPLPESLVGTHHLCYVNQPPEFNNCQFLFIAWAVGGTTFDYPLNAGQSLGTPEDPVYFRMEMHYNNVQRRSGMVDSSGLRVYLTKQIRQHDAGVLQVGVIVDPYHIIPPYYDNFLYSGYCDETCLASTLTDEGINAFAVCLHSHLAGKSISSRIFRNGTELPPLLADKHYDFNFQEMRMLPEERTIRKGDSLVTDCYYDTSKRTGITSGGLSTMDEMCLSFILYYPRIKMGQCLSRKDYSSLEDKEGKSIFSIVQGMDFTNADVRDEFQKYVNTPPIYNRCYMPNGRENFYGNKTTVTVPYKPHDDCNP